MEKIDNSFARVYVKKLFLWLNRTGTFCSLFGFFLLIGSPFFINQMKPLGRYLSLLISLGMGSGAISVARELEENQDVFKVVFKSENEVYIDKIALEFHQERQKLQSVPQASEQNPSGTKSVTPVTTLELGLQRLSEEYETDPNSLGLALVQIRSGTSKTQILKNTLNMTGKKWDKGSKLLEELKQLPT